MSYFVKVGVEYLSAGDNPDIWTSHQSEAYRFDSAELAENCARAWRRGAGSRTNARVVSLVLVFKKKEVK